MSARAYACLDWIGSKTRTSSKGSSERNLHNAPTACSSQARGSHGQLLTAILPPRRRRLINPKMAAGRAAAPNTTRHQAFVLASARRRCSICRARAATGFVRGGLIYTRLSLVGRWMPCCWWFGQVRQTTPGGGEAGLNKRPASGAGATCAAMEGSPLPFFFPS
jgi:hypothetical protein